MLNNDTQILSDGNDTASDSNPVGAGNTAAAAPIPATDPNEVQHADETPATGPALVAEFASRQVLPVNLGDGPQAESIVMLPVTAANADHPNVKWGGYMPKGLIELTVNQPDAMNRIRPDRVYRVTIEELAPAPA